MLLRTGRPAAGVLLAVICAACGTTARPAPSSRSESATIFEKEPSGQGFVGRLFGRGGTEAPPEPTPFDDPRRSRKKALTVPTDTVNALKLMAQDWVLAARERGPRVRTGGADSYIREYNTFNDKYTLEIERAGDDEEATLIGYVFLDSTHLQTAAHPTAAAAEVDTNYQEQRRKMRMTFHLLERWEFSELADGYVFNRVWTLERVQYKPIVATRPAPAPPVPAVSPPQATPRPQ